MTEAAQQAYVTTQRTENKKAFYLFRFPFILNIIGTAFYIGGFLLFLLIGEGKFVFNTITSLSLTLVFVGCLISSSAFLIMRYVLYKQVLPKLKMLGFNEFENKAFQTIFKAWL
jgi:hypothetical protein